MHETAIHNLRQLIQQDRWEEAQKQLNEALQQNPNPTPELRACQTWILLYHTQELDAYPIVLELLRRAIATPTGSARWCFPCATISSASPATPP